MSDEASDRDPFEVVAESFLARYRAGERPSIEDLAARHPELSGPIRKLLPALVRVERDLSVASDDGPGSKGERSPLVSGKGWRLGGYRILREIGRGGMGVVYEAEQLSLGRRVALEGTAPQCGPRSHGPGTVPPRGQGGGPAASHEHRAGLRSRLRRRGGLLRDAVHPGPGPGPGHRRAGAAARS